MCANENCSINTLLLLLCVSWVYPDQSHSLPNVRKHQYLSMVDFFEESFDHPNSRNYGETQTRFHIDDILGFLGRSYHDDESTTFASTIEQDLSSLQQSQFQRK